ncbi:MAG: biopolymer transporter ExbD [Candidatus Dependentiae bacterium]|nr:biopolymer transporter ExbD [Candidatus Dependentiae bacterium]
MVPQRLRRKRRPTVEALEISLTPLIDTAFVLLMTFMIAMPVMQNSLNIELPSGSADEAKASQSGQGIVVCIDRSGKLYLQDECMHSRQELIETLGKRLSASREEVVYVSADAHVLYEQVAQVIDDIKYLGGVRYVALALKRV